MKWENQFLKKNRSKFFFLKKTEHSQQIAGKRPSLTGLLHIGIETEKKEKLTEIFLFFNVKKILICSAVCWIPKYT